MTNPFTFNEQEKTITIDPEFETTLEELFESVSQLPLPTLPTNEQ